MPGNRASNPDRNRSHPPRNRKSCGGFNFGRVIQLPSFLFWRAGCLSWQRESRISFSEPYLFRGSAQRVEEIGSAADFPRISSHQSVSPPGREGASATSSSVAPSGREGNHRVCLRRIGRGRSIEALIFGFGPFRGPLPSSHY